MSDNKLGFNVITPKDILIICNYDFKGKCLYKKDISKLRNLFTSVIPQIKYKYEDGTDVSIFYPVSEIRLKNPCPELYKGARKRIDEDGIGIYYKYMGFVGDIGMYIEKLHNIISTYLSKCRSIEDFKIIWGSEDGSISTSIHEHSPFRSLNGWGSNKQDEKILENTQKKWKEQHPN